MRQPSTQIIDGTYKTREVTHYYNSETGLNVFFDMSTNKYLSGWLLSEEQAVNVANRGAL